LIAEKLETEADFQTALAEGFEYFQGYHFCRPGILESRPIPINGANYLAVLRSIEDPGLGLD
jgi:EAL and modified HD-GYP domain-containing signal transduction protein